MLSGCVISNNPAGAVAGSWSTVCLTDCVIEQNTGGSWSESGGAEFMTSSVTLSNCLFKGNVESSGWESGGGLYCYESTSRVVNCIFDANTSDYGAASFEDGTAWVRNCTFLNNQSAGVYGFGAAEIYVQNSVLWNNASNAVAFSEDYDEGAVLDVSFSCLPEEYGTNNITIDPQMDAAFYQLLPISPCIDQGNDETSPATDFYGAMRWDHSWRGRGTSISDQGAVEFVDADVDSDGMGDRWEVYYFTNTTFSSGGDDDGDGLSSFDEYRWNSHPLETDTDQDGLSDGDEVFIYETDPADADTDDDSLTDGDEVMTYGSDPLKVDGDDDLMPDAWEVQHGLLPDQDDSQADPDLDGLNNYWEYRRGTDPHDQDSDGDTLLDGAEHDNGTDPAAADSDGDGQTDDVDTYPWGLDSDGDGMPYDWEVANSLDFTSYDADNDADLDGLTNIEEYQHQTDPRLPDTDADGLSDGFEVNSSHTEPLLEDTDADLLCDGDEVNVYSSNPLLQDTDGDQMIDGFEVDEGSNLLTADADADADGDGISNIQEFGHLPIYEVVLHLVHPGPPWEDRPVSGPAIYANGKLILPSKSGEGAISYGKQFYARPGEKLVITHGAIDVLGSVEVYTYRNCTRESATVYPFDCSYHVETAGQTNTALTLRLNDDDDNGDGTPDCENEIIDGPSDTNDMGRLVVDEFEIHPDAPSPEIYLNTADGNPPAGLRFFDSTTGSPIAASNNLAGSIRNGNFSVWVEGTAPGRGFLGLRYAGGADSPGVSGVSYGHSFDVNILAVELTAHRPTTEGPAYGNPFQDHEVPDDQEESPGAGIRINGDTETAANENDLIEVELEVEPFLSGVEYSLRRNNSNIKVWDSQTMSTALLDSGTETNIIISSSPMSVWVENPSGGTADLEFVAEDGSGNDICSDKIHFYPFSSVIVLFEGEFGDPADPPQTGISQLALDIYQNGYDVHLYEEPDIGDTPNAEDEAFAEIDSAVEDRSVTAVAVIGYSHGGGSTYRISDRMDADATVFNLSFTAYIDAISQPLANITAEDRRPVGSAYHVNYYQDANVNDAPLFLDGAPCTPAGAGFEDNVDDPTVTESHTTIDDAQVVHDGIRTRLASYVAQKKGEPPQKLVGYMYEKVPDAALSSMAHAYLDKSEAKTLVNQVKSEDEAQAVDRLSKRSEWWAKLYAAEKMKQNPKRRDPELIKQLKKSKHAIVRETLQGIRAEKE